MICEYTLGIKELDFVSRDLPQSGSNIMMIGSPMNEKEFILNHIMYHGAAINGNAVITVTTRESATHILEWFKEIKLDLPLDRIGIIDCVSKTLDYALEETENIKIASISVDFTGIGVKISQFFEEFSNMSFISSRTFIKVKLPTAAELRGISWLGVTTGVALIVACPSRSRAAGYSDKIKIATKR